jgi:polyhydroxyalkanoate synthase
MINRGYILDLIEDRSLMAYMYEKGFCPVLLEWGESVADNAQHTIAGAVQKRLLQAAAYLAEENGTPIHVLGYCMGGTMLAGALALRSELFASAVLLAAPWDFHAGSGALLRQVQFWSPSAFPVIDEKGLLGVDWMQMLFASLDPEMTAQKFMRFAGMKNQPDKERIFIAVEDWLNDGVDLPGDVALECLQNWFLYNTPACGQWKIDNTIVRPDAHDVPVLVVASSQDRLVEKDTASAYALHATNADNLDPRCGHIGMIASRKSVDNLWHPMSDWLRKH